MTEAQFSASIAQANEQARAIREGSEIAASDEYFAARPQIASADRRKVFRAGFERGWDAAQPAHSGEPVYAFRRKGLDDFCTCTEKRYAELSAKPNLFETRIFYTAPQPSPAAQGDALLAATSTALEVLQKHRQMKGDWPMGELGRRAAEELQAARYVIFSTARAAQEGKP